MAARDQSPSTAGWGSGMGHTFGQWSEMLRTRWGNRLTALERTTNSERLRTMDRQRGREEETVREGVNDVVASPEGQGGSGDE